MLSQTLMFSDGKIASLSYKVKVNDKIKIISVVIEKNLPNCLSTTYVSVKSTED